MDYRDELTPNNGWVKIERRYRGNLQHRLTARAPTKIGLTSLAYNMKRFVWFPGPLNTHSIDSMEKRYKTDKNLEIENRADARKKHQQP